MFVRRISEITTIGRRTPGILSFVTRPVELVGSSKEVRRGKKNDAAKEKASLTSLIKPIPVKSNSDDINVGAELTGELDKDKLSKILYSFTQKKEIKSLAMDHGLDYNLQLQVFKSFRKYCLESPHLPSDLHVCFSDIIQGAGNVTDIYPYFMRFAKEMYPHIECIDDLKEISDLRLPANWYPIARAKTRKIIFHAGPTNSGKTYHAMKRFIDSESGVYCGPLKLLAVEVFQKCNEKGTDCDLVTGEEKKIVKGDEASAHCSSTVEMVSLTQHCEVAVIDEIQMIKDPQRGWAWTRALLGVPADEIHVCGEGAALELVQNLCLTTGETVEVRNYKRLTELKIENKALGALENVQPGDCIVCFSKNDIYTATRTIEATGKKVAVIYGSLPPSTKLAQAAKFNDPKDDCKILVATDAIGMGLNLHIRRIIFYSLTKPTLNQKGELEIDIISVSSALQIAGRAGRYGTQWPEGYVTTLRQEDLPQLTLLLQQTPATITKAGLHPTADQIELYAYHLPQFSLSNLMDIFVNLCTVDDSMYFMCQIEDFKFLADMIQHVPLPLRSRYIFCCAPISRKNLFLCTMFLKFARQYSKSEFITADWVMTQIGWPLKTPRNLADLVHLEAVFDVLDLYLWLSYRFRDLFPHADQIRYMQKVLDEMIQQGMLQIVQLLKNADGSSVEAASDTSTAQSAFNVKTLLETSDFDGKKFDRRSARSLTKKLLDQGLLTQNILDELQKEWLQANSKNVSRKGRSSKE